MPEVLRVIARMNLGGPARHVIRIEPRLAARGWRSHLVTGRVADGELDLLDEARDAGLRVSVLPELGRAPHPLRDLAALAGLRRLLSADPVSVVHTHTAKAGLLGRLAAGPLRPRDRPRPRLVHSYHGHVLSGYFGPLMSAGYAALERRLAARTDALVAVSERVRDELLHEHRVGRAEQFRVIPPGIDPARTAADREAGARLRSQLGVGPDEPLAGWVGRYADIKQVPLLLAAWAARRSSRGRLLLIGAGPEEPRVRQLCAGRDDVHLLPPRRQLGAIYGALDLFVLPSRREGLPQAVVEARAAGLPVLASDVGGLAELVRDGVDGRLLPPDAQPAWTRALDELLGADELRRRLAAASAARPPLGHEPEQVAARLADLYDELSAPRLEPGAVGGHAARPCGTSPS